MGVNTTVLMKDIGQKKHEMTFVIKNGKCVDKDGACLDKLKLGLVIPSSAKPKVCLNNYNFQKT